MKKQIQVQTELVPAYAVIHLSGYVNTFAEQDIEGEIQRLLAMNCPLILLDFSRVEHINSAGITILIGLAARVRDHHGCLAAYGLSEHYRKIFRMVGLEEFITIAEDRQTLVDEWRGSRENRHGNGENALE